MSKPLKVLLVEDSPDDAELLLRQLRAGGYAPLAHHVDTPEAMDAALEQQAWDVIISDYVMPRFDAPAALKLVQKKGLDVPFIIVSGAVGEETAVSAMKAGAADYMRKDNLARLAAAITRELADAAERRERRRLEKEVLDISTNEQRRIGQNLHDVLGQDLTGIAFLAKVLQRKLEALGLDEARDAVDIGDRINSAIQQTRALARLLCPAEMDEEGLMIALRNFSADVEKVFNVSCRFTCDQRIGINDNIAASHLYHIAQESVNNAIKHGQARNIAINLTDNQGRIALEVRDDGHGIPPAQQRQSNGMGLNIMNYRARMIGGVLAIECLPDGGTMVSCTIRRPG